MKQIYTCIIFCLLFGTKAFSNSVTVRIDSTGQGKQTLIIEKCDTLIIVDNSGYQARLSKDTMNNGNANLNKVVPVIYTSSSLDTFIYSGLDTFKTLYIALVTGKIYFKIYLSACTPPPCNSNIVIRSDSALNYTFIPIHPVLDSTSVTDIWTLDGDTIPTDSLTHQSSFKFDSSGSHQVCLYVSDTLFQCTSTICKTFKVEKYIPLLDSINIWHLYYDYCFAKQTPPHSSSRSNCGSHGHYNNPEQIYTDGDTLIDSIAYKQVIYQSTYFGQSQPCLAGFVREDITSRKVYYRTIDSTREHVLYDFSMLVGDTISITFDYSGVPIYFKNGTYHLDSIKYFVHDLVDRKVFYLNTRFNGYPGLIWVEGLGYLGHPFYSSTDNERSCGPPCLTNPWSSNRYNSFISAVTCFSHKERVYFDTCLFNRVYPRRGWAYFYKDSCTFADIPGAIHEIPSLSSFTLSPNPATDYASIELDVKQSDEFSIIIQNLEGQQIGQEIALGWLQSGIQTKTIRLPDLSSGIYLVGCKTKEGTLYKKLAINR